MLFIAPDAVRLLTEIRGVTQLTVKSPLKIITIIYFRYNLFVYSFHPVALSITNNT